MACQIGALLKGELQQIAVSCANQDALETSGFLQSAEILCAGTNNCFSQVTECAVQEHVLDHAAELFEEGDTNHDGSLSCNEILLLMRKVIRCTPLISRAYQ